MNFKAAPSEYHIKIGLEDIESHLSKLVIDGECGWRLPNALEIAYLSKYQANRIKPMASYTFWFLKSDNTIGLMSTNRSEIPKEDNAILLPVLKIPETLVISPVVYHRDILSRDEAAMYCFTLDVAGDIGWRLPTKDEVRYMCSFRTRETSEHIDVISIDDQPTSLNYITIPVRDARPDDQNVTISDNERIEIYLAYRYRLEATERTFRSGQGKERLRQIIQSLAPSGARYPKPTYPL